MFLRDDIACTLPNSATPMSQAAIDAQNRRVASVGRRFDDGNSQLNALLLYLGGNTPVTGSGDPGAPVSGDSGIPTAGVIWPGTPGFPVPGSVNPPGSLSPGPFRDPYRLYMGSPEFRRRGYRNFAAGGSRADAGVVTCTPPQVLPLATVFPVPAVVPVAPPAPAPRLSPVPAVQASAPPPPDCGPVTPDNVCQLAQWGCFDRAQLSEAQWYACAWAGWAGNQNRYPGGGRSAGILGTVNPCPKNPRGETMPCPPGSGMSGAADDVVAGINSGFGWSVGALGVALLAAYFSKGRR